MNFHILTLFPDMVMQGLNTSIIGRAIEKKLIAIHAVNIRDYTLDKHGKVDDYPYGGGAGMLMQAQPVFDAWKAVTGERKMRTVYVTPQGQTFTQKLAKELAEEEELIFLCGHYEGIDERVLEEVVTDYVSIGDYVLTGGELPAMVMIDAISRLVPGVLNNDVSADTESFHNDLLEYPQYSRPEEWHGKKVPQVLLSGDHSKITAWRLECSKERTKRVRPDLYRKYARKEALIKELKKQKRNNIHMIESLERGSAEILYWEKDGVLIYNRESKVSMLLAADAKAGQKLLELIPVGNQLFMTNQVFLNELICERFPGMTAHEYYQSLYTQKEHLKVAHKDIRPLTMEALPYVSAHYDLEDADYLAKLIRGKAMYGAYVEDHLVGFIGMHDDGSLGLLFVDEAYRRSYIGESLACYYTNRVIEQGHTPYGHTALNNVASLKLQERMGYYMAEKTIFWVGND